MTRQKLRGAAAALLLLGAQRADAAAGDCIPRQQVADMTIALLPPLIDETRKTCGNRLAANAFMNTGRAGEMSARYRAAATSRIQSAAQGIRKLGEMEMPEGVTDETLVKLMGEMLPSMAFKSPDADVCGNLNEFLGSLAPLNPDQAGRLISAFFALADVKSPSICKT